MSMPHLLDRLAERTGCSCLSDLRRQAAVYFALEEIPAEAAPAEMWRETLFYLTGENLPEGTAGACRGRLLAFYRGKAQDSPGRSPQ